MHCAQGSGTTRIISFCVRLLWLSACAGCSDSAVENPYPFSPTPVVGTDGNNDTLQQNSKKVAASPSMVVETPTVQCNVSVTYSPQIEQEGIRDGAVLILSGDIQLSDPLLVYRVPSTITSQGSLLSVSDMIFGETGSHPSGIYTFELHSADGKACLADVTITPEDAQERRLLTLNAVYP